MATERMVSRRQYNAAKDHKIDRGRVRVMMAVSVRDHPDLVKHLQYKTPPQAPPRELGKIENMLGVLEMRGPAFMATELSTLQEMLAELQWYRANCSCDGSGPQTTPAANTAGVSEVYKSPKKARRSK